MALALAASACTVENDAPRTAAGEAASEDGRVVFTCMFDSGTKTALGESSGGKVKVEWCAGDEIRLFWTDASGAVGSVTAIADGGGSVAAFPADVPSAERYWAVYPASACDADGMDSNGRISLMVPSEAVSGDFADANICAAISGEGSSANVLSFRNVVSILRFSLSEASASVSVASCGGEALAGAMTVEFGSGGDVSVSPSGDGVSVITTSALGTGEHFVAALPGSLSGGLAIRYDEDEPAFFDESPYTLAMSHIVNYGAVEGRSVKDWYFTPAGSGGKSGESWDDAGDANLLVSLLDKRDSGAGTLMQVWRLNGTRLNLAAGTYAFGSSSRPNGVNMDCLRFEGGTPVTYGRVSLSILGGYPSSGGSERDPSANETVLSGGGQWRILQVRDMVDLTLDGLTLADAYSSSATKPSTSSSLSGGSDIGGSALYISDWWVSSSANYASEALTRPHVVINSCVFRDNVSASSDTDAGSRECISIAKGTCHVSGTVFRGNRGRGRGCIGGCGAAGRVEALVRGELFFNACLFEDNYSTSASYGTVLYHNSKGMFTCFYNCTFRGNTNPAATDRGVIYGNRNTMIANCTFVESPRANANNSSATSTDWSAVIRFGGNVMGCLEHTLANNIVLDEGANGLAIFVKNDDQGILTGDGAPNRYARVYSGGGNIYNRYAYTTITSNSGITYGTDLFTSARDRQDESFNTAYLGMEWDAGNLVYRWNGQVKGFSGIDADDMATALRSNSDVGDLFYNWLVSEDVFDKDALGVTRTGTWTPGAYQAQ